MPEPIDRQVALAEIDDTIAGSLQRSEDVYIDKGLMMARTLIEKFPTIEPEVRHGRWIAHDVINEQPAVNRWIPVEDDLPNDRKCVLVTDGENIEITYFDGSDWEMHDQYGNHYELYAKVTHWMPLPEPPEKEDET